MVNVAVPPLSLVVKPLVGLTLMIFFALSCQCLSTLAVVRRETGGFRWPLFLFCYMTVLAYLGFPRELAHDLVVATLVGSSEFAAKSDLHPAQLRNAVTSPGGTSAAAIYELEKGRIRTVFSDAVWAAYRRTVELGERLVLHAGAFIAPRLDDGVEPRVDSAGQAGQAHRSLRSSISSGPRPFR
jgi:hypothetical protein